MKKIFSALALITLFLIIGGIYLTPKHSVIINAPIDLVWTYASDSTKANEWSVFFDHISPLAGIADGLVGSIRRCYRFKDNTGPSWDEEVIKVIPKKHRELRTYNLKEFKGKRADRAVFKVFQDYKVIDGNKTKLTFSTFAENPFDLGLMFELIPSAFETKRIFKYNLNNIKTAIEAKYQNKKYKRPHPFEAENKTSDLQTL